MSLTPTLPEPIHVICLCTCSFLHPEKQGVCDALNPAGLVDVEGERFLRRIPICQPCADALHVLL